MRRAYWILGLGLGVTALGAAYVVRRQAPPATIPEPTLQVSAPAPSESASTQGNSIVDAGADVAASKVGIYVETEVDDSLPETLAAQREQLFKRMAPYYPPDQLETVKRIFAESELIGQGNPKPTQHPMKRSECMDIRRKASHLAPADPRCGHPNMVPVYAREALEVKNLADGGALPEAGVAGLSSVPSSADAATVCIDQYEFPNIACEYPVVYARASEADKICKAVGKRLCDAHEWEGACAGSLRPLEVEYAFGDRRMLMQWFNNKYSEKVWAYGSEKNHKKCATGSFKNKKCGSGSWSECGSNTYPTGAFPECVSAFGVYDQHGNAAEHMNMPLAPEELASRGGLGETEMKGSWFIFENFEAHPDDCRYRAPAWHATKVDAADSHRNFHLGFRCCSDVK
ncbi:MAG: SUMF1/EgtB/PvdO family nonheme iron enzyme [Polyangiaceae bacterium]|nr:SUMF1/EgtB/PvdO family nonheme iron enzyme [Myxococcales bacterium]MCB9585961.1 SUMF1/EgtB/PvdO family nonheme iron enzyme [Polyangiaceae bacterium]MCB9607109.1 SUMF1/EgtB/PvdO family nonheme iron enzyme [Polyangiaceae bacterium]